MKQNNNILFNCYNLFHCKILGIFEYIKILFLPEFLMYKKETQLADMYGGTFEELVIR